MTTAAKTQEPAFDCIVHLLAAASTAIGVVEKRERNTQGKGFNFRGIDTVVNAASPEFRERGIIVSPETLDRVYEQLEVGANRTLMGHAMLRVRYTFFGPTGDSLSATVDSEAFDSGDKAVAKAMSIALRTALLQVLMLPTDEVDPDASSYERSTAESQQTTAKPQGLASESQVKAVFGKAHALGMSNEQVDAAVKRDTGKEHPDQLTSAEARTMLDKMQKAIDNRDNAAAASFTPPSPGDEDVPF